LHETVLEVATNDGKRAATGGLGLPTPFWKQGGAGRRTKTLVGHASLPVRLEDTYTYRQVPLSIKAFKSLHCSCFVPEVRQEQTKCALIEVYWMYSPLRCVGGYDLLRMTGAV
jgi:hypothetical protein